MFHSKMSTFCSLLLVSGVISLAATKPLSDLMDHPAEVGDIVNGQILDDVEKADDDDNANHMTHYLNQILEQVRQGHVTQAKVDEWKKKLRHALQTGSLTQDQYNQFKSQVRAELFSQSTNNDYCSSCLFLIG